MLGRILARRCILAQPHRLFSKRIVPRGQQELHGELMKALVPIIGEYLGESERMDSKVIDFKTPADLHKEIKFTLPETGHQDPSQVIRHVEQALQHSVRTSHPLFLDKLYAGSDVVGQVGEWVAAVLNTNVHTYAVAPVFAIMETELLTEMRKLMGFDPNTSDGIFCPGGSFANMMAAVVARDNHPYTKHIRLEGMSGMSKRPVILASVQSHYSVKRAAMVLGLGMNNIVWVDSDVNGTMSTGHLRECLEKLKQEGLAVPFFLHATAGTTVTGGFDKFHELADVCQEYNLHFHVDAAWGGSVVMSENHRGLMSGVERAHSITWNPHKMMGIPLQCSALLVQDSQALQRSNALKAEYLFHNHDNAAYDLGDKTLQCGRKSDSFKFWLAWQFHGRKGFEARVDNAFMVAQHFASLLKSEKYNQIFELVMDPVSLNVCFWYKDESVTTAQIYDVLQARGNALVNFNPLPDHNLRAFFRVIFNNSNVTKDMCGVILDEIIVAAEEAANKQ